MIFNDVFHQGVGKDQEYLPTKYGFDHYTVSCQVYTNYNGRFRGFKVSMKTLFQNYLIRNCGEEPQSIYNLQLCCMLSAIYR